MFYEACSLNQEFPAFLCVLYYTSHLLYGSSSSLNIVSPWSSLYNPFEETRQSNVVPYFIIVVFIFEAKKALSKKMDK